MKIYLAGTPGTVSRERELSQKFASWKRLFTFYWMNCIEKSEILKIVNENISGKHSSGK